MQQRSQAFELFADYHQFHLWDSAMNPEAPTDYTEDDVERRIKTGPHVVVINPERNMTVSVEVQIHDSEPPLDPDDWDHIAEANLHVPSGQLQVHECTGGPVADWTVEPGWYRVRSLHGGLSTVVGLEGNDYYRVLLWPAPPSNTAVIKQWGARSAA